MTRLTALRETLGMTKQQLGALASVSPARVGTYENGREIPRPGSVTLARLARALGWGGDPAALLDEVADVR
jgi:transcriptional regulator with XRE-family HTH domain